MSPRRNVAIYQAVQYRSGIDESFFRAKTISKRVEQILFDAISGAIYEVKNIKKQSRTILWDKITYNPL